MPTKGATGWGSALGLSGFRWGLWPGQCQGWGPGAGPEAGGGWGSARSWAGAVCGVTIRRQIHRQRFWLLGRVLGLSEPPFPHLQNAGSWEHLLSIDLRSRSRDTRATDSTWPLSALQGARPRSPPTGGRCQRLLHVEGSPQLAKSIT